MIKWGPLKGWSNCLHVQPHEGSSNRGEEHPTHELQAKARLEHIVRQNFSVIWRLARRWGLSSADADDVAQRAVLIAAKRLSDIEPGRERAFLCSTTLHLASKVHRSAYVRAEDNVETWEHFGSEAPNPEELLQERRGRAELDAILAELPGLLRAVFVLFELEFLTQAEIADTLQIPPGTVASRLRKAREMVAASIERSVNQSRKMGMGR